MLNLGYDKTINNDDGKYLKYDNWLTIKNFNILIWSMRVNDDDAAKKKGRNE